MQPQVPLHSLERLTDVDLNRRSPRFELCTTLVIGLRLVGPTQPGVGQAAEIVAAWILAALIDRRAEQLVRLIVLTSKVGVYALTVHFLQ